jgi:hypothetical protein
LGAAGGDVGGRVHHHLAHPNAAAHAHTAARGDFILLCSLPPDQLGSFGARLCFMSAERVDRSENLPSSRCASDATAALNACTAAPFLRGMIDTVLNAFGPHAASAGCAAGVLPAAAAAPAR